MNKKKLTANSKLKLIIRIILVFLTLIFIPLQSIADSNLTVIEKNNLFNQVEKLVSFETLNSSNLLNIFHFFRYFINKDFMGGFSCVLYTIFHPFVALKLIFSVGISFYFIILMKCFYQSKRPSWDEWEVNIQDKIYPDKIIECEASFSNPSGSLFIFIFYFIYSLFSYKSFYKPNKQMNLTLKFILFLIFISFIILEYCFLLIYKLHFLHEMVYTTSLTLVLVCLLMDFDDKFQLKFYNATKNLFKVRKHKIKSFFYCVGFMISGIVLYNFFTPKTSLYSVEEKLALSESCTRKQREELGIKNTFMEISYIFCLMGSFWGSALTIEHNPNEWWYQPLTLSNGNSCDNNGSPFLYEKNEISSGQICLHLFKSFITASVFFGIWYLFNFIPYIAFEFNFIISCIKYFLLFFICTGILPIIYGCLGMNKKRISKFEGINGFSEFIDDLDNKNKEDERNLFEPSLFVEYSIRNKYPLLYSEKKMTFLSNKSQGHEIINSEEVTI